MKADQICDVLTSMMAEDKTTPEEAVSALGKMLSTLLMTICESSDWSIDACQASLDYFTTLQDQLQEVVNEHIPENIKFMSLDDIRKRVKELSVEPKEADIKARANACETIMEVDTLGFLLLCYQEDGNVTMCSNLREPEKREKVLTLLREILYGNGKRKFKM